MRRKSLRRCSTEGSLIMLRSIQQRASDNMLKRQEILLGSSPCGGEGKSLREKQANVSEAN